MNHPIALHQTTLTYPDGTARLTAVDRADLEVDAGELVFLVGPSGSGKSSLLALAAGLTVPDSGSVRIAGRELTTMDRGARTRWRLERIGMVFQQANLLDALTAREQLTVMASLHGERPAAYRRKADDLLEAVGLAEVRDRYPAQLSGGQRQRVAIARALVGDPSVLLVDEPTAALDHERGEAVMELLRAATVEHDLATLVVTHDLGRLRPSDRVMRCEDGVITPDTVPV